MCQKIKIKIDELKKYFCIALQCSILLIFQLLKEYNVTSFKGREIGIGLANNVDITSRINNFTFILCFAIPLITILLTVLIRFIME